MNILITILLLFSILGFLDKMFSLNLGLEESIDKGFSSMGSLAISIIGIYTIAITFINNNSEIIEKLNQYFFFDISMVIGSILAPDIGGYPIINQISQNEGITILAGVLLSSTLGCTLSFQLPIFLSYLETKEIDLLMKGFVIGIMTLPFGLIMAYPFLNISFICFIKNIIPVLLLCLLIVIMLNQFPNKTINILKKIAEFIQFISYLFFFIVIVGIYIPTIQYVDIQLLEESLLMVLKMVIIVSGSMVLSKLILKYFSHSIQKIANLLSVNQETVIGFILNCASSLAMLPLYSKMDKKGKLMNAAFSVSGAYVFGAQLAFIASIHNSSVTLFVIIKIISGLLAVFVADKFYRKWEEKHD